MMNYTIIIPHRNIPNLLERLLKSIPERDDLEIIIVDDCSDSNIVNFELFPGKNRKNLKLIRNEVNHGAGYSRNSAVPLATGKWIIFADADDFFNDGFDEFLTQFVDSNADVVYFSANSVDSDTYAPSYRADHIHDYMKKYNDDPKKGELILRYLFSETVCKLVKSELIKRYSIVFDDTSIHEDVRFACSVGHHAKEIAVVNRELYCITSRKGSLCSTLSMKKYLDELKVFARWKKFLMDNQPSLEMLKFDYRMYNVSRHLYKDNKLFRSEYRILREVGFTHAYIIGQIIKYLWKSVGYKLGRG
ncbi:MAG: glycosyltransferase family 2 protein [Prevotella sp.]|nr:glycosyltransferase family 2 protein [Prevotella sp.]